jgi:hypothetical protein
MREREALKRYRLELGVAMVLYAAVLVASIHFGRPMPAGTARTLLLLSPAIPLVFAIWAIVRQFGRMDEFVRLRSLENFAVAGALTAGLSFTYGFLETAGFPKLSMFWVWAVMGFAWSAIAGLRWLVAR